MRLSFDHAAVLLWLPAGVVPGGDGQPVGAPLSPPAANPVGCWSLGEALLLARDNGDHFKSPWIKVGAVILTPDQVTDGWEAFKNGHPFEVLDH